MKRNENLVTLSWEHHDGLVVSFRLQQGLKKNVNSEDMVDYILYTWENVLEHHFWQEEQIINQDISNTESFKNMISQMENDHKQIRNLITEIKKDKSNTQLIQEFADILNQHIRFEERQLFPAIESESSKDELNSIGKFLKDEHKHSCEIWNNQFWKN